MLDKYRAGFEKLLSPFAGKIQVQPNLLTWISLPFALMAGVMFYFSFSHHALLALSGLLVAGNGFFDALDGKVARLQKKVSPWGDFLDHVLDRYADTLIVGGIALSEWCDTRIGLLALVGVLLTSYLGTQAQAVGHKRKYEGFLTRADRLTILIIAPFIQLILIILAVSHPFNRSLLEWVMIYFAIIGNATALQRFISISTVLKKEGG